MVFSLWWSLVKQGRRRLTIKPFVRFCSPCVTGPLSPCSSFYKYQSPLLQALPVYFYQSCSSCRYIASTLLGLAWWRRRKTTTSMGGRRGTPGRGREWVKRFFFSMLMITWCTSLHSYHISIDYRIRHMNPYLCCEIRAWVENAENKGMEVERRSRSRERRRRGSGEYHQPQDPRLQVNLHRIFFDINTIFWLHQICDSPQV